MANDGQGAGGADGGSGGVGGGATGGAGGGGAGPASFVETISPEYRDVVTKNGFTDVNAVLKSYVNQASLVGNSIRIPGEDAGTDDWAKFDEKLSKVPGLTRLPKEGDAEGWSKFMQKLGAPEAPTGYGLAAIEGIDENQGKGMNEWFANVAHKAGLTKAQAAALHGEWAGTIAAANKAAQEAHTAAVEALKQEWGAGYEQRIAMASEVITKLGGADLAEELDGSVLGNHPQLAKMLLKVHAMMGEDRAHGGLPANLPDGADELRAKINEVMGNKAHAYHDNRNPGHKDAVAKVLRWQEQLAALRG